MHSIQRMVLAVGLVLAPVAYADETPLPQVVVEANRTNLAKLAKEIRDSEKRFYKRYNELNKVRDYAIKCTTEASTGTRFTRTDCQPVFQDKAQEEEARQFLAAFGSGDQVTGTPTGVTGPLHINEPPPPTSASGGSTTQAGLAIAARRPGFQKHMLEVTTQSPELTRMAQEHAELWKRYEAMYRKLNGSGPVPEEKASAAAESTQPEGSP